MDKELDPFRLRCCLRLKADVYFFRLFLPFFSFSFFQFFLPDIETLCDWNTKHKHVQKITWHHIHPRKTQRKERKEAKRRHSVWEFDNPHDEGRNIWIDGCVKMEPWQHSRNDFHAAYFIEIPSTTTFQTLVRLNYCCLSSCIQYNFPESRVNAIDVYINISLYSWITILLKKIVVCGNLF